MVDELPRAHPAITVGRRAAVREAHAVQHAVAHEQVTGLGARLRIGPVPDIVAAKFGRQRAFDRKIERLDLSADGGRVGGGCNG